MECPREYIRNYVPVKSSYAKEEIEEMVKRMETKRQPDGKVLGTLMYLAFYWALKRSDLLKLEIKDVYDKKFNVLDEISINNKKIEIANDVKQKLEEYLLYLKGNRKYKTTRRAPLFPGPQGGFSHYNERALSRHLPVRTEKLRQSGICFFYKKLKLENYKPYECLKKTAEFAQCKIKETINILKDTIPWGRKTIGKSPF